jgi:hypothetical protein
LSIIGGGEAMVAFFIGCPILCDGMTCYNRFKKRLLSALPKGHEEK